MRRAEILRCRSRRVPSPISREAAAFVARVETARQDDEGDEEENGGGGDEPAGEVAVAEGGHSCGEGGLGGGLGRWG